MVQFTKWARTPSRTSKKIGPWTFRKNGHHPKIHCIGQKFILDKLEGAAFKYDNSSLKFKPETYPNRVFLVPNLNIFSFLHEILQFD